jgi:hypothetical protein
MKAEALAALLLLTAGKKKAPAKPPPPPATDKLIHQALDGAQDKVAACVIESVTDPKFNVTVKVHLTINSAGQLMGAKIVVTPDAPKTVSCVDEVMHGLTFPKSTGPIVDVDREWNFSQQ